jgi:hypothetical protein
MFVEGWEVGRRAEELYSAHSWNLGKMGQRVVHLARERTQNRHIERRVLRR